MVSLFAWNRLNIAIIIIILILLALLFRWGERAVSGDDHKIAGFRLGDPFRERSESLNQNANITTAQYDPDDWNNHTWHNKYNLVHVFQTDFLRYQQDKMELGRARFELFETFTLPSMMQQTQQQFLWIIYTDPDLNHEFSERLKFLVNGMPNVIVFGFHRFHEHDFRTLHGMDLNTVGDHLIYGDSLLLIDYFRSAQTHVMIETRLDADDGLSLNFAESIQGQAATSLGVSEDPLDYRVFCAEHHVEWRYYKPGEETHESGHLVHYYNPEFCVNSGLTIGYQLEARQRHLIHTEQCYFAFWMNNCGDRPMQIYYEKGKQEHRCLARVYMADQTDQVVIMPRTPVAAGMKHVLGTADDTPYQETYETPEMQAKAWEMLQRDFNVVKSKVMEVRSRFEENIEVILNEALLGQCTPEHSCKDSSKKKLGRLLDDAQTQVQTRRERDRELKTQH